MSMRPQSPRPQQSHIQVVAAPGTQAEAKANSRTPRGVPRTASFDAKSPRGQPVGSPQTSITGSLPSGSSAKHPVGGHPGPLLMRGSFNIPRSQARRTTSPAQMRVQVQPSAAPPVVHHIPPQPPAVGLQLSMGSAAPTGVHHVPPHQSSAVPSRHPATVYLPMTSRALSPSPEEVLQTSMGSMPSPGSLQTPPEQPSLSHTPAPQQPGRGSSLSPQPKAEDTQPDQERGSMTVPVPMPSHSKGPMSARASSPVARQHSQGARQSVARSVLKEIVQSPPCSGRSITVTSQLVKQPPPPTPAWARADAIGSEASEELFWTKAERRIEATIDSKVAAVLDSALQEFRTFASACVERFSDQLSTEHSKREQAVQEVQQQLSKQQAGTREEILQLRADFEFLRQQPATAVEVAMDEVASARLQLECLRRDVNSLQVRMGQLLAMQTPVMSGATFSGASFRSDRQAMDADAISLHSGERSVTTVGLQIDQIAALISRLGQDLAADIDCRKSAGQTTANGELPHLSDSSPVAHADFNRSLGELDGSMRSKVAKLGNELKALAKLGDTKSAQQSEHESSCVSLHDM
mmetsp:Transcript_125595/g.227827  ORF Transcript_125595/g.227827 Transcript_125595/m.227827 type:complete len:579 (-) Transcript_125595:20-1756(-)